MTKQAIRTDVTKALIGVEMQSPDPERLATHWGKIIGVDARQSGEGVPEIALVNCRFRFSKGTSDMMSGLTLRVGDVAAMLEAARARGYAVTDRSFMLGGVKFDLLV